MVLLYEELGLNDKRLQRIVSRCAADVMMRSHSSYGNKVAQPNIERQRLDEEFKEGLAFLQENAIIRFSDETYLYRVVVINEYRLDRLVGELSWLETYFEGVSSKMPPPMDNMAAYERSTGRVIINGNSKTLKGTNKKLFDTLYIANPEHASRSILLRIIGEKRREQSSEKIALNEAFSNLRKVCGVTSSTISLSKEGGKLKARIAQLRESDEIYLDKFLTD